MEGFPNFNSSALRQRDAPIASPARLAARDLSKRDKQ
jgi:hypothetical protein